MTAELLLPPEFPRDEFLSAELHFRARRDPSPEATNEPFREFAAAWVAVAFRYLDVLHFDRAFRESLARYGGGPPINDRYVQERQLFGFFVCGLSAIESLCYGLCAIAWEAAPRKVSLATVGQRKGVSPETTADRFRAHFPKDTVTSSLGSLAALSGVPELDRYPQRPRTPDVAAQTPLRFHRLSPEAAPPSEWGPFVLDASLTASRRDWLRDTLADLLGGGGLFAAAHF